MVWILFASCCVTNCFKHKPAVQFIPSLSLSRSVHCSSFRCRAAGWLMVNAGLGPGGQRGEEVEAREETVTFHCHYSSVLCSRCAEECLHWDGVQGGEREAEMEGWMGQGVEGERRGGGGGGRGFERWRSHGVKVWDTSEDRIRDKDLCVSISDF